MGAHRDRCPFDGNRPQSQEDSRQTLGQLVAMRGQTRSLNNSRSEVHMSRNSNYQELSSKEKLSASPEPTYKRSLWLDRKNVCSDFAFRSLGKPNEDRNRALSDVTEQ